MSTIKNISESFITVLSCKLKLLCERNSSNKIINQGNEHLNKIINFFVNKKLPSLTIKGYLKRLLNYLDIEQSTLILSFIYIDRIRKLRNIVINDYNIYKLLLASIVVAIKYNEDLIYPSEFYAEIGGVSIKVLNKLENYFLYLIDYKLFTDENIYNEYHNILIDQIKEIKNNNEENKINGIDNELNNKINCGKFNQLRKLN